MKVYLFTIEIVNTSNDRLILWNLLDLLAFLNLIRSVIFIFEKHLLICQVLVWIFNCVTSYLTWLNFFKFIPIPCDLVAFINKIILNFNKWKINTASPSLFTVVKQWFPKK